MGCAKCQKDYSCLVCVDNPFEVNTDTKCFFENCKARIKNDSWSLHEGKESLRIYFCEDGHIYCKYWKWDDKEEKTPGIFFGQLNNQWQFLESGDKWRGFGFLPEDFQKELNKFLRSITV